MTNEITISRATTTDLSSLASFLALPEIDQSFVSPLSCRQISIKERVQHIFTKGFWIVARHENDLVGCWGCKGTTTQSNKIVEFSTLAVAPEFRARGIGFSLVQTAVQVASQEYKPFQMKCDSWSENRATERILLKIGFQVGRVFDDPSKRPPSVKSVEYILDCVQ